MLFVRTSLSPVFWSFANLFEIVCDYLLQNRVNYKGWISLSSLKIWLQPFVKIGSQWTQKPWLQKVSMTVVIACFKYCHSQSNIRSPITCFFSPTWEIQSDRSIYNRSLWTRICLSWWILNLITSVHEFLNFHVVPNILMSILSSLVSFTHPTGK